MIVSIQIKKALGKIQPQFMIKKKKNSKNGIVSKAYSMKPEARQVYLLLPHH